MNSNEELINYIADYLGVNINSDYVVADINEVEDKDRFIDFMKQNINHEEVKYLATPLQKLTVLKELFKRRLEKEQFEAYRDFEAKVWAIGHHRRYKNPNARLEDFISPGTKEPLVSDLEKELIESLGGVDVCYELYESRGLKDAIKGKRVLR